MTVHQQPRQIKKTDIIHKKKFIAIDSRFMLDVISTNENED